MNASTRQSGKVAILSARKTRRRRARAFTTMTATIAVLTSGVVFAPAAAATLAV